jgi:hypothetical protein
MLVSAFFPTVSFCSWSWLMGSDPDQRKLILANLSLDELRALSVENLWLLHEQICRVLSEKMNDELKSLSRLDRAT